MGAPVNDPRGIAKWIPTALVVSLAANLFLGGFVAARFYGPKPPAAPPAVIDMSLRGLPQGLSSEAREELENSLRAHRRSIRAAYRQYRDQQRQINNLLSEDVLNEKAIADAYEQLRKLNTRIQQPMQRALFQAVRKMDAKARRQLIELRHLPRARRFGRPESVDGSRWSFELHDGGFQFDLDGAGHHLAHPAHPKVEFIGSEDAAGPEDEEGGR